MPISFGHQCRCCLAQAWRHFFERDRPAFHRHEVELGQVEYTSLCGTQGALQFLIERSMPTSWLQISAWASLTPREAAGGKQDDRQGTEGQYAHRYSRIMLIRRSQGQIT